MKNCDIAEIKVLELADMIASRLRKELSSIVASDLNMLDLEVLLDVTQCKMKDNSLTFLESAREIATRVRRAYEAGDIVANEVVRSDIEILLDLTQGKVKLFSETLMLNVASNLSNQEITSHALTHTEHDNCNTVTL